MRTARQVIGKAITDWIEKAGDRPATQIKLCHAPDEKAPYKVQSWTLWTNLQELANSIYEVASEHAHNGKGGTMEEYHLFPYFGTELEEGAMRRFQIPIVRSASTDEGVGYSEGPTKTGMIGMDMRHLEQRHRQVDERDANLWGHMERQLAAAQREIISLRADLKAANEGLEEAKDRSLERKLQIFKANQEESRKDRVIDAVVPVAMQIGNAMIGAPVFQVNTDDQSQQAIISFLSSLNTKQLDAWHAALDPQQKIFFDHVIGEIKRIKQAQWEQKQKEAQAKVNGVEKDPKTMETLAKRDQRPEAP